MDIPAAFFDAWNCIARRSSRHFAIETQELLEVPCFVPMGRCRRPMVPRQCRDAVSNSPTQSTFDGRGTTPAEEARGTPPGAEREKLMRRARQAETTAHMQEWLASPGLQGPR
jgi:hypothetical protein